MSREHINPFTLYALAIMIAHAISSRTACIGRIKRDNDLSRGIPYYRVKHHSAELIFAINQLYDSGKRNERSFFSFHQVYWCNAVRRNFSERYNNYVSLSDLIDKPRFDLWEDSIIIFQQALTFDSNFMFAINRNSGF